MAIKKSELYSSLWAGCDELRGSMDASQYKDYVLVLLFMKYVSDKHDPMIELPKGASFYDMVKQKGQPDIGDKINKIIGAFAKANGLTGVITVADFNDDEKLGKGKDKVDKLTNLISIFEKPELNFSGNRADGDDLLGDAYEYLMKHFATESGKSKGQFYTPSEVSRVMAKVIGISQSKSQSESLYDPTGGSGSLLLKAADEAPHGITIYGQENDNATRALAVMNMWLHNNPDAVILQGNTLADPQFKDETTGDLKTFDYAVSNPPFSYKAWMNGLDPLNDDYKRFDGYNAVPPKKNGDYAFLLHLIKSLKSKGKACIVLPLGVLFRGNAEGVIRKKIIQKGYIKGIIGLPANLFYGTGIAACLVVIDKENAQNRKDIFMIDASRSYMKDGNKNRLRSQDIHKIVDVFNNRLEIPGYARAVSIDEIADPKNDYNLNIPRYIDSQEEEDIQDIEAHLTGGIPGRDIEALAPYWKEFPELSKSLFQQGRQKGYYRLKIARDDIKTFILNHPEFERFGKQMDRVFAKWRADTVAHLNSLKAGLNPKQEIQTVSESLLKVYHGKPLMDKYDIYQHLMDYWAETMQDDFYEISADGWKAGNEVIRIERKTKKGGREVAKPVAGMEGLEGTLIPPDLMIRVFFDADRKKVEELESEADNISSQLDEMREEHGGDEGCLGDLEKVSKASVSAKLKTLTADLKNTSDPDEIKAMKEEMRVCKSFLDLIEIEAGIRDTLKQLRTSIEKKVIAKYPALRIEEIKTIVIEKKWVQSLEERIRAEIENISHRLTNRIKELAQRYETPLPELEKSVNSAENRVASHLKKMGFVWK